MTEEAKGFLEKMFGGTPLIKSMDFFMAYPDFDYTKSFVSKEIGVSRMTMEKIWSELIKRKFIVKTKNLKNAVYYKFNKDNPSALSLTRAINGLIWEEIENEKIAVKH